MLSRADAWAGCPLALHTWCWMRFRWSRRSFSFISCSVAVFWSCLFSFSEFSSFLRASESSDVSSSIRFLKQNGNNRRTDFGVCVGDCELAAWGLISHSWAASHSVLTSLQGTEPLSGGEPVVPVGYKFLFGYHGALLQLLKLSLQLLDGVCLLLLLEKDALQSLLGLL